MSLRSFAFTAVALPLVFAVRAESEPAPAAAPSLLDAAFTAAEMDEARLLAEIVERRKLPITTDGGPAGKRLQEWAAEGTAAGLAGDWYDNRDRDHSRFAIERYPQVRLVEYSASERAMRRDWAAQWMTRPLVVFGNSSTSAPATQGGSNPRHHYTQPAGLRLLDAQYRGNNLYVYPEHQDHDAGRYGDGGWGDLYPTNTPCVLISQGSSGSDQPFLDAIAVALSALRPEVKAELVGNGALMPAVQRLFRQSLKNVPTDEDYLSAKAHPTVFDGSQIDPLRLAELAHALTPDTLPPLVQLRLVESDDAIAGRDFFEAGGTEELGSTPSVVARVFRAAEAWRRCVVSAAGSRDLRGRELTFRWVLLRGDAAHVRLAPRGAECEIVWDYHERASIAPGAALESNRVDIGVFAHNGIQWSAPAFVTSFTLDSEARTYDDAGRILEIGYGMGEAGVEVADWPAFLEALDATLDPAQQPALAALAPRFRAAKADADAASKARAAAEKAKNEAAPEQREAAEAALKEAIKTSDAANRALADLPDSTPEGFTEPLRKWAANTLRARVHDIAQLFAAAPTAGGEGERKRLLALGIVREVDGGRFESVPLHAGDSPAVERLSRFQREQIARWNAALIAQHPGLRATFHANLVDFRLTAPRTWRDVYHYDATGTRTGWTRHDTGGPFDFTADGALIETRDALSRPTTARPVRYTRDRDPGAALRWAPEPELLHYEYTGPDDHTGHVATSEPAPLPAR